VSTLTGSAESYELRASGLAVMTTASAGVVEVESSFDCASAKLAEMDAVRMNGMDERFMDVRRRAPPRKAGGHKVWRASAPRSRQEDARDFSARAAGFDLGVERV
jgi:hypothetical protein